MRVGAVDRQRAEFVGAIVVAVDAHVARRTEAGGEIADLRLGAADLEGATLGRPGLE